MVPFDALLAPIAREMFSGDAKIVSLLSVSVTIGTILGSLTFAKMKEEKKNNTLVTFCGIVLGVYYVFICICFKIYCKSYNSKITVANRFDNNWCSIGINDYLCTSEICKRSY